MYFIYFYNLRSRQSRENKIYIMQSFNCFFLILRLLHSRLASFFFTVSSMSSMIVNCLYFSLWFSTMLFTLLLTYFMFLPHFATNRIWFIFVGSCTSTFSISYVVFLQSYTINNFSIFSTIREKVSVGRHTVCLV